MGNKARRNTDRTWETTVTTEVLRVSGIQTSAIYIGRRQGIVDQWVALRTIFEFCAWDTGF